MLVEIEEPTGRMGRTTTSRVRVFAVSRGQVWCVTDDPTISDFDDANLSSFPVDSNAARPVESDPATIGALLGAVREHYPGAHAEPNGAPEWDGVNEEERAHWWAVYAPGASRIATGPTEFAALLVAYNAAPELEKA